MLFALVCFLRSPHITWLCSYKRGLIQFSGVYPFSVSVSPQPSSTLDCWKVQSEFHSPQGSSCSCAIFPFVSLAAGMWLFFMELFDCLEFMSRNVQRLIFLFLGTPRWHGHFSLFLSSPCCHQVLLCESNWVLRGTSCQLLLDDILLEGLKCKLKILLGSALYGLEQWPCRTVSHYLDFYHVFIFILPVTIIP